MDPEVKRKLNYDSDDEPNTQVFSFGSDDEPFDPTEEEAEVDEEEFELRLYKDAYNLLQILVARAIQDEQKFKRMELLRKRKAPKGESKKSSKKSCLKKK